MKRWFVTGASSGFGREIVRAAVAAGDEVVATVRDPASVTDFPTVRLDVTDPAQRDAAVAEAVASGGIDVLVNNAGHGLVGALEELSDADLRYLLEVNVLGPAALVRAVLPHLRARGGGHVVQMSSIGGVVANPGHAAYAITKFALEGMSEALAAEVAGFGVRVTIVEPGPFRTGFAGRSLRFSTALPAYAGTPAGALRARITDQDGVQPGDPARAAQAIVQTVHADGPRPLRLPLGAVALDRMTRALHRRLTEIDEVTELARWTDRPA
jgi:NAD(P)-dependent dehydrogenase (short-subunit alcohol dehydrogenase family)